MVHRPTVIGAFEFATLSALRAAQLTRGCRPRIDSAHSVALTAQMEVAESLVERAPDAPPAHPHKV